MPRTNRSPTALLTALLALFPLSCREQTPNAGADGSTSARGPEDAGAKLALPHELQVTPPVCALKTEHFLPLTEVQLTAGGTTPPFATVASSIAAGVPRKFPRAELGIPGDEDLPFTLRLVGGAEIRGFVPRTFAIHASGPLALGKFAAALPHTGLRVTRATSLDLEAEGDLGETVESLEGPLRARGPCGLFAIERRDFNPTTVIPGVKWKQDPDAHLKRGKKIPLTVLPVGEPSAKLLLGPKDDPSVAVFEKQNGRAHIAWLGGSVLVHGWIAETELTPIPKGAAPGASASASASASGSASGSASPAASAPPAAAVSRLTCAEATPLVAQTGESRTTVGTLRASAAFDVLSDGASPASAGARSNRKENGWASVRVEVPLLSIAPGTRLLVRESDLAACTPRKKDDPR